MKKVLDIQKRILHKKNGENETRPMEIIDRTFDGFFQVPNIIIDQYARILGAMTMMVYMAMKRHAGAKKECWPSVRLMAFELGMSSKTVIRGIADLEEHKIIKVDRTGRDHNVYEILNPRKWRKVTSGSEPAKTEKVNFNLMCGDCFNMGQDNRCVCTACYGGSLYRPMTKWETSKTP